MKRFDIFLVTLDPTGGAEMQKTCPCVVVSPDELHQNLRTAVVAPLTTILRSYPTRVELVFADKTGQIALDQIRTVDKTRLIKYLGTLEEDTARQVSTVLVEMFTY